MTTKPVKTVDALEATKETWSKMTFGGLVRALRLSDEITQVALAKKLRVSNQFLNDLEHNRKDVGFGFAKKVSKALGYSIEPLIELLIRDQLRRQKLNYIVNLKKAS